ncbi:Rod shape-determining protein MreC [hydrothermal vent metagenome]|uniref:Rod shape-determining protein MreC n=1 Tax=hydrothermal vent metagenome TaxID=652676 RepID=A0A1W1BWY1_9ZZZZ
MNKKLIFIILLSLTSLFLFQKEEKFQETFSLVTLPIKEWYLNLTNQVNNTWEKYTEQSDSIDRLKKENILLRKYLYNQKMTINRLQQYSNSKVKKYDINKNILHVQTLSYKKINDFSYIYLTESDELEEDKIYGLIQKNVAAGIAIKKENRLEGILLSNEKCQFSTFIGDKNMPGIAKGIDEKTMEINFIPKWSKIAIGDKVVTSGLDNIFLANIPVGTVSKILTRSTYKTAIINTYADILRPDYFYLVKKVPIEIQNIDNNILQTAEDNKTIAKIDTAH